METGAVNFKLMADITDLMSKMQQAQGSVAGAMAGIEKSVGLAKTALGFLGIGLSVGGLVALVEKGIESQAVLKTLSMQTGMTVETLSALRAIAKLSGNTIEDAAGQVTKLEKNMLSFAQNGGGKAANAFQQLGYSQAQVKDGLQHIDTFLPDFAKRLVETGVGGEQAGLAMQLLGKSGAQALPFLMKLAEAQQLQTKVTTEQAEAALKFQEQLIQLKSGSGKLAQSLANELLPVLSAITDKMLEARNNGEGFWASLNEGIWAFENKMSKSLPGMFESYATAMPRQIKTLTDELADLQATQKGLTWDIFGQSGQIQTDINAKIRELARAQKAYDDYMLKSNGGAGRGYVNPSSVPSRTALQDLPSDKTASISAIDTFMKSLQREYNTALYGNGIAKLQEAIDLGITGKKLDEVKAKLLEIAQIKDTLETSKLRKEQRDKEYEDIIKFQREQVIATQAADHAFIEATKSADAYIATLNKQYGRDVAGIGKGNAARTDAGALFGFADKRDTAILDAQKQLDDHKTSAAEFAKYEQLAKSTYSAEVAAYVKSRRDIMAAQGNWVNGWTEALANYQSEAANMAGNTATMFTNAFNGMTDGMASSVSQTLLHGKSLEDGLKNISMNVADAFLTDFLKIQLQHLFMEKVRTAATVEGATERSVAEVTAATVAVTAEAGIASTSIMMNAWKTMAATYAAISEIPIVGPFMAPLAAAGAFAAVGAIVKNIAGSREHGGPVSAGSLYRINEAGPEVLSTGGRDYLMMGSNGGHVTPNNQIGGTPAKITIINQTSANIGKVTEKTLPSGERVLIIQEAAKLAVATTAAHLRDANSSTSRAMAYNYSMQRSR